MKNLIDLFKKHLLDRDIYLGILTEVGFVISLLLCGLIICFFLREMIK